MRAAPWWIALIGLCSCAPAPGPLPAPVELRPALCPRPLKPALPQLDPERPLDDQLGPLSARETLIRGYLGGLERIVRCYEAQTGDCDDR